MNNFIIGLVAGFIIGFLVMSDSDSAVAQIVYCNGVANGEHPDYNGSYNQECLGITGVSLKAANVLFQENVK